MSDTSTALDEGVEPTSVPENTETDAPAEPEQEAPQDVEAQFQEQLAEEDQGTDDGDDVENEEPEEAADAEEDGVEEGEEDQEPDEYDEFDFGGNKMQLPKGSVPDELRSKIDEFVKGTWSDYTRKSQDVAEKAKAIEARESVADKLINLNGEALDAYSRGLALKQELEQLQTINVDQLWQEDPDQARQVSDLVASKQAEFGNVVNLVNQKETELTKAQTEELDRRKAEGRAAVAKAIPNFAEKELVDYAIKAGIPEQDAGDWALNPAITAMAWKAMHYDRMQAKAKAQPKKAAPPPEKPMRSQTTRGTARNRATDLEKMTDAQFRKQLGGLVD